VEKPAASLIKLPLTAALEEEWQSGRLGRDPADRERARKAITVSDNAAADALIARLGMARVNEWLEQHRFTHTRLLHKMLGPRPKGPNVTSAADMSRMLLEIEQGSLVSGEASADMRKLLLAQERRSRIPAGLPPEAICGNKTGTLNGVVHDAAFIECPNGRRYTIAVLVTHAPSDRATSTSIARLSRSIYSLLSN
jgi:beta-lactamase class A